MLYAFNIGAARESFARAAALDPSCAMAFYGEALAEITDINVDTTDAMLARGRAAIERAAKASEASPDERRLIAAAALRFSAKDARTQDGASKAYETAMTAYAAARPDDADGLVEAAFAIWHAESAVTTKNGQAIGPLLDRALRLDPAQFGAHHLRVHFEEESSRPADALPNAEFLYASTYDPGESHLPHMAGHIFDRVGDYARMIRSNQIALANDAVYFRGTGPGVDYMRNYHQHDLQFVLYGLTTIGEDAAARALAAVENRSLVPGIAIRFHDPNAALASGTKDPVTLAVADAELGRLAAASASLASATTADATVRAHVRCVIDTAKGATGEAVADCETAYAGEPSDLGDPKEHWLAPYGEAYGAALLRAKRFADAARIFARELGRYPNDPRLLAGRALAREGLHEDGAEDRAAAAAIWKGSRPPSLADLD